MYSYVPSDVEDFLTGEVPPNVLYGFQSTGTSLKAFGDDDRAVVGWCLVVAKPELFGFVVRDGKLVGPVRATLEAIFPSRPEVYAYSSSNKLHRHIVDGEPDERALNIPPEVLKAVQEHIGNPQGGIAQYFTARGVEVPVSLRPEVVEAVIVREEVAVEDNPANDRRPEGVVSASEPETKRAAADPIAETAAQDLLERLRKAYGPEVLALLRDML